MMAANMMNQALWGQDKAIRKWMRGARLDGFSDMISKVTPEDTDKIEILNRLRANAMPAMGKLQQFMR